MRIELLTTGDELVTGQIIDTNGPWLMERLFALGETVVRKTTVGDDLDEIAAALRSASARADVVAVSGGLGPTLDDLTVEAACRAFGRDPVTDEGQLARIRARFAAAGRELTPNNTRQAVVPDGAEVLGNELGTATAFVLRERGGACELWFLPGVPRELCGLAERHLLPRLARRLVAAGVHRSFQAIKCHGLPESHMDMAVRPLLARHPHVRYGTRTAFPENHVKLVAEGESAAQAAARCEALAAEVRAALGDAVFGGAADTFASVTLEALRRRGWRAAFAESLTGGLACSMLAEVPGASAVLLGGQVTYAVALKESWLGVGRELLEREGPASEAVVRAMAEGVLARSGADVAVALSGWADTGADSSGGGSGAGAAGTVHAAIAGGGLPTRAVVRRWLRERNEVRRAAAYLALDLLRRRALGCEGG